MNAVALLERPTKTFMLVEDNPGDARLMREMLRKSGANPLKLVHLQRMSEAETHLAAQPVDVILLDLGLPDAQGIEAIRRARAAAPATPLLVISGLDDGSLAIQALQEGAQDYIIKGQIEPRGLLRALSFATERKSMAMQIIHSAQHDFLTGLPNRALLNDRIGQAIAFAARRRSHAGLLFLDLDGFKHINDSLGHPTGDKLLQSVAGRLLDCVRKSDTVSRQGGDEFIALLAELVQPHEASLTVKRILAALAQPHLIDGQELHVTASIGVSIYPDDGTDAETLLKNADTAMYQSKENGRNTSRFFKPEMNAKAVERQSIEAGLRNAVSHHELALHYQPIINLNTGDITGAEALLRWTHPQRGPIPPAGFITIAEESGLIVPIGNWALREACRQTKAWAAAGLRMDSIAVNISAVEFRNKHFLEAIFAILKETGLDPTSLALEITEAVLIKHSDSAASTFKALADAGIRLSIDDFGTGYSSLSNLTKFPIDALKIDQSFVRQIKPNEHSTLLTTVLGMGRNLQLRVIAEGVETAAELAFLQDHQCAEAQGYYLSHPVSAAQFEALLKTGLPRTLLARPN